MLLRRVGLSEINLSIGYWSRESRVRWAIDGMTQLELLDVFLFEKKGVTNNKLFENIRLLSSNDAMSP